VIKSSQVRVLIVDDNQLHAQALKRALERRHDVRTALTVKEALYELERELPDTVVCGFEHGAEDSIGLLRTITRHHPSIRRVLCAASRPDEWVALVQDKLIDVALARSTSADQLIAAIERA